MKHFDVAVIGTGSGNTFLDERYDGLSIALIEEGVFGGTCLNVGCIPTKMFVYPADLVVGARRGPELGVDTGFGGARWPEIVSRVFGRIDPIAEGGRNYRREDCPNITVFEGHATFTGPRTIDTGTGETITADQVVVATGSRAVIPQEITDAGIRYYTNDDVMRLPELPRRLAVLGTGYIAAEFAHVFSALGAEVTVIGRSGRMLRQLDDELSVHFTELSKQRWDCRLDTPVVGARTVDPAETGAGEEIELTLDGGDTVRVDAVLVAVGRRPNSDLIGAAAGGIELDDAGLIVVDEYLRTTAEGVFALGDVCNPYQLKHVANHEARVVGENLLAARAERPLTEVDHRAVPAAVFTEPQIASVGLTEAQAREQYRHIAVKTQTYGDVAYGWAMEDTDGRCKVIADQETGLILGAHIVGAQASLLIQPLIQAMVFGQTATEVARGQYWIHPALTEVVENALLGLDL